MWSWGGLFLLIISLWFQVQMTVAINTWYGKFYDLLQNAGDYVDNPQEGIQLFFRKKMEILGLGRSFPTNHFSLVSSKNDCCY